MVAVDNFLHSHSRKSVSSLELGVELAVEAKAVCCKPLAQKDPTAISIHAKGVNREQRS